MLTLTWAGPATVLAAGHNCVPIAFRLDSAGGLGPGARLEEDKKAASATGAMSARTLFQAKDTLGQSDMVSKLNTTHQNQISEMRHYAGDKATGGTLSTVAGDGKLVLWDLAALKMKGLKI
jgi:actin related protein 2/3 complex subunit 1A/1B